MTSPVIGTPWKKLNAPVSEEALEGVDKYWRVANYLSIGQIYLRSNPLMKAPFTREDVKHRLVGHWGTTPGLNFLIGHINLHCIADIISDLCHAVCILIHCHYLISSCCKCSRYTCAKTI